MPELDFTPLLGPGKFFVSFENREQAAHFLDEVRKKYNVHFFAYRVIWEYGSETAYAPRLNTNRDMTYQNREYFLDIGYKEVPYNKLLYGAELGEVSEDDLFIIL